MPSRVGTTPQSSVPSIAEMIGAVGMGRPRQARNMVNRNLNNMPAMAQAAAPPPKSPNQGFQRNAGAMLPNLGGFVGNKQPQNTLLGGPQLGNMYRAPSGPVENLLFQMMGQGPGMVTPQLNPLVGSLAGGNIPPAVLKAFQDEQQRQTAGLLEQYSRSNSMFGSDAASFITRQQGQALNNLMAQTYQQALGANSLMANTQQTGFQNWFQGLSNPLLSSEQSRTNLGMQMMWQEYLQQQGVPPELLALLQAGQLGPHTGKTVNSQAGASPEVAALGGLSSALSTFGAAYGAGK